MVSSKTHRLSSLFSHSKFQLTSELLSACIGYGSRVEPYGFITGLSDKKRNGYAILLRLMSMAFDVNDVPIDDDRIYTRYSKEVDAFIASLSKPQLNEITGELKYIYLHLQGILNDAGVTHIKLRREIGPRELPQKKLMK